MADEAAQMAEADTAAAKADGMAAAAQAIPMADEPLDPGTVNAVWALIGPAIERLTDGQMEPEPYADVEGPVDQVPPELGSKILALGGLAQSGIPALEPYSFDPIAAMKTNAGLQEASTAIERMSRDKAVLKAMKQGPPEPVADEPDDMGEEPETEE